jgi:hypothetical protein
MSALSALQEQAIRLMRTKWEDPNLLAQELFLILSQASDPLATGPVTTTPDGAQTSTQWPSLPAVNFDLPNMDFPELPADIPSFDDTPAPDTPGGLRTKKTTIPSDRRVVVPAQVTGGSGNQYTVSLYPNGSRATDPSGNVLTVTAQARCDQIDPSETIPAGTWVWCYRYTRVNAITTQQLAQLPSGPWVVVSQSTQYKVISQTHDIIVPVWLNG